MYPAYGKALRVWLPLGVRVFSTYPRHPHGGKPNGRSREVRCLPPTGWDDHGTAWEINAQFTWAGKGGYWHWVYARDIRPNQVIDERELEAQAA